MKTIITLLLGLAVLAACTPKLEKENMDLKAENDSLKSGNTVLVTTVDSYDELLKEIDKNLASIDETSALVRDLGVESGSRDEDVEENIKKHIRNIGVLLENSRLKIISLDKNLNELRKNAGDQSEEILKLDQRVKTLANNLLQKESEMTALEKELRNEIMDLELMLYDEMAKSMDLRAILNRVFYIAGTAKELKDRGVIQKQGGFIGLGKVKVLNAQASDTLFTQLKKDDIRNIDLFCKKAQLITTHPDESYAFALDRDDRVNNLTILNRDAFWKNTNYLVIEVVE